MQLSSQMLQGCMLLRSAFIMGHNAHIDPMALSCLQHGQNAMSLYQVGEVWFVDLPTYFVPVG